LLEKWVFSSEQEQQGKSGEKGKFSRSGKGRGKRALKEAHILGGAEREPRVDCKRG